MIQTKTSTFSGLQNITAIALLSASGILLEITLTRLFSALHYPQTVFVVLSLAVLGIGLGASLATASDKLRQIRHISTYIFLAGVSAFALTLVSIATATTPDMILSGAATVLTYMLIGLSFSTLFSEKSRHSRTLYAADLIGAGIATLMIIPLLNAVGAINGLLFCVALFMLTALIYKRSLLSVVGVTLTIFALASNLTVDWLSLDMATLGSRKPITEPLTEGTLLTSRWDSFARTDLVKPADGSLRIYVDGAAASVIPPAENNEHLIQDIGFFAFVTAQPESVFTIGSGGGLDVWFGLEAGAEKITAVEVNPQTIALVEDYAEYSGDLYHHPNVRVVVDEGRSVLRRENRSYDLIFLSQVVTLTSERAGYAMTENAVFTLEAFGDYLSHLNDDGYLSIKLYDEITMSRALSVALSALKQEQNLTDVQALDHIIAMLDPSTSPPTPLLMIKKTPFIEEEVIAIGRIAQRIGFATLFLPGIQADPPLDAVVSGVNTFDTVIDISPADLSPPTDDRPFFYQFSRELPSELQSLLVALAGVVIFVLGTLILYQWRVRLPNFVSNVSYFALLGMGFMMIEIALIQQTRLLIGHPTLAVSLVIATLLIGGGIGSLIYRRFVPELHAVSWKTILLLVVGLLAWFALWQTINPQLVASTQFVRIGAVTLMILPLGLLMGIPFPSGLTVAGQSDSRLVAIAWGINGIFSVVGSVGAIAIALSTGFSTVWIVGSSVYLLAMIVSFRLR